MISFQSARASHQRFFEQGISMSKTFVLAALLCFSLGILAHRLLFEAADNACHVANESRLPSKLPTHNL